MKSQSSHPESWRLLSTLAMIAFCSADRFRRLLTSRTRLAHNALPLRTLSSRKSNTFSPLTSFLRVLISDLLKYSSLPADCLMGKKKNYNSDPRNRTLFSTAKRSFIRSIIVLIKNGIEVVKRYRNVYNKQCNKLIYMIYSCSTVGQ